MSLDHIHLQLQRMQQALLRSTALVQFSSLLLLLLSCFCCAAAAFLLLLQTLRGLLKPSACETLCFSAQNRPYIRIGQSLTPLLLRGTVAAWDCCCCCCSISSTCGCCGECCYCC